MTNQLVISNPELYFEELRRGSLWPGRWRNEMSPDQRCWTPNKVLVLQTRGEVSSGRVTRSAPPCPCPVAPCPDLRIPRTLDSLRVKSAPQIGWIGRTLDDLPMHHTQEDALSLLERRRAETAAQRRNTVQESGEIRTVSSFSRRMFDSAVSSRGQAPPPAPSPSEAAALFFRASRPSWSSNPPSEEPKPPDSGRLKSRPHSMTCTQASTSKKPVSFKPRPDSEPPTVLHRGREFNHLRYHRQVYPNINELVRRYNEDMRVVCTQTPEVCERRRNSRDFSVASGFLLVPLKQEQIEAELEHPVASREANLTSQLELKTEDQLAAEMTGPPERSVAASPTADEKEDADLSEEGESEGGPAPPWRCWVDDATVSTVHSHAASEAALEDEELAEDGLPQRSSLLRKATLVSDAADNLTHVDTTKSLKPGQSPEQAADEPAPAKSPVPAKTAPEKKDRKGKKKKEEALPEPPPPPPVEELPIVVEEMVEEVEPEPEPEPEPVPPTYICPSSESKSHDAEIRRWLSKSPFSSATRTMPIF